MGGFLGGLGGLAGAITGLGPTVETLGQGLQINDIAKMQNARNAAAQKLVEGLPDEYAPLRQAGQASGDWIWAMGLVGGTEGEVLRTQHTQQTIKDLMAQNPGMSFQQAAAQAAAAEGDWDTFSKINAEAAKGAKGGTLDDKRTFLASRLNSMPPELHDDTRKFLDNPDASDMEADNLTARLKEYDGKRFNVTTKPYKTTIGGKSYEGEEETHEEEMPGDYSSESATPGGGEAPAAIGSGAPVGAPPPASPAGGVSAPPPAPPAVGDTGAPPTITGLPPGSRVTGLHEVPGPAAAQQTLIQKNLQIMGPTAFDLQNKVIKLGGGDINKAQKIFDNSIGQRAVEGFLHRYPPELAEVMLAMETFNGQQPNALRSSQSLPLSRYGMAHQEKPIGAATDFWSLMSVLQDTRDTVSQSLEMNGWTPNPAFSRVQSVAELRAKAAAEGGGSSSGAGSAPTTDIHGRKMRFVPGP
jgi:hypothetical protein